MFIHLERVIDPTMQLSQLIKRMKDIEGEASGLLIRELLIEIFLESEEDLSIIVKFLLGRVFPAWDNRKLDIGPSLCYSAIALAAESDVTSMDIENEVAKIGEIGTVAQKYSYEGQRGLFSFTEEGAEDISIAELYRDLKNISETKGKGSVGRKRKILSNLFGRCGPLESRYLARLVLSEMRIGVGEGAVRDGISGAFNIPVRDVERALQVSNDFGYVAEISRKEGSLGLQEIKLKIGRPISSMLAQASTIEDALEVWETIAVEPKYDGARIQAHFDGDSTHIFSRNMEDVTDALPEVVEFIEECLSVPAILDGEVVAIDTDGKSLPFQEVLRRFRRKHDIEKARNEIEITPYFFDCMHYNGEDLLESPLTSRRSYLETALSKGISSFWLVDEVSEIKRIDKMSLEKGFEGIMLKNPGSLYNPGKRGKNWLKCKPGVSTLDCIITGAEWGEGRRAKFLGTFEMSVICPNADSEIEYKKIGRVGTGLTDLQLQELTEMLSPSIETQIGKYVVLAPTTILEVGYEEIQRSQNYSSGYALRFPRVVAIRKDKELKQADTFETIEKIFNETR